MIPVIPCQHFTIFLTLSPLVILNPIAVSAIEPTQRQLNLETGYSLFSKSKDTLADLPNGEYLLCSPSSGSNCLTYFNFRKINQRIVGLYVDHDDGICIDGKIDRHRIVGFGTEQIAQVPSKPASANPRLQGDNLQPWSAAEYIQVAKQSVVNIPMNFDGKTRYSIWFHYNRVVLNIEDFQPKFTASKPKPPRSCQITHPKTGKPISNASAGTSQRSQPSVSRSQTSPKQAGGTSRGRAVFGNPNWQAVPGTSVPGSEQFSDPSSIDLAGIARRGNILEVDVVDNNASYTRLAINCETQAYRRLRYGSFSSRTEAQYQEFNDGWGEPNEYLGKIIRFACSSSEGALSANRRSAEQDKSSTTPQLEPILPSSQSVAKYPSQSELNQLRINLRQNPSLSKLTPTQMSQRQAFQRSWASRNPAAARFLGSWSTSNSVIHIYPSQVKHRVCVVTQRQDQFDIAIGLIQNRELRYGDRGLFWLDRLDVLAARETGKGMLSPTFATMGTVNLTTDLTEQLKNAQCSVDLGPTTRN